MITCNLQGGLGNQMFQIAAASALAWRNEDEPIFDLERHDLPQQGRKAINYLDNIFRNVTFKENTSYSETYNEPHFSYKEIAYTKNMCLKGYFQSEKYFKDCEKEIKKMFKPSLQTKQYIEEKYGKDLNKKATSIHIRRGDYITIPDFNPLCTPKYYAEAIKKLPKTDIYMVFSDDKEWCKNIFKKGNFKIIEEEDYIDLYIMSMCKNNIIANSSFSWWSAWLNSNEHKKIAAPKNWFHSSKEELYNTQDLIPDNWLLL